MVAAALQEGVEFAAPAHPASPADSLWLDEDSFVAAIDDILGRINSLYAGGCNLVVTSREIISVCCAGGHKYSAHARQLCLVLDPLRSGRVHWAALLERLLPAPRPPRPPAHAHKPIRLPHCQVRLYSQACPVKLTRNRYFTTTRSQSVLHGFTCLLYVTAGVYSEVSERACGGQVLLRMCDSRRSCRRLQRGPATTQHV